MTQAVNNLQVDLHAKLSKEAAELVAFREKHSQLVRQVTDMPELLLNEEEKSAIIHSASGIVDQCIAQLKELQELSRVLDEDILVSPIASKSGNKEKGKQSGELLALHTAKRDQLLLESNVTELRMEFAAMLSRYNSAIDVVREKFALWDAMLRLRENAP